MLRLVIPKREDWDDAREVFIQRKEAVLQLEHSLISLSKWESKWCKPFLSNTDMTTEEVVDYIRCMTLTQNIPLETYERLTNEHIQQVSDYINAPMTATTFREPKEQRGRLNKEIITAELIYYWMISLQIPFECRKWHLNQLLTLIKVCNIKNTPPKKMSKRELMARNTRLNAERKAKLNSKG